MDISARVMLIAFLCLYVVGAAAAVSSADIVAKRRAMLASKPYTSLVPRSNEPVGKLTILRVWPDEIDMRLALGALQGLVNRDRPRIYIGLDKPLYWLEYHGGKVWPEIEYDVFKVFETYKERVKGLVIYDSSVDGLGSIAVTYAGIEDLIPATPELAERLSARFGWKVAHDLRGRWQNRLEAYQWAYENLLPRCNKYALMHFNHGYQPRDPTQWSEAGQQIGFNVDYAVAFRLFVWHIGHEPVPGEMDLAVKIMESAPLFTPVVGASTGLNMYPEPYLVCFIAKYTNLFIPFGPSNVSVLSGARIPDRLLKRNQPLPARDLEADKVYVAFTNSEHDNMEHLIGGGPPWQVTGIETDDPYRMWWCDPQRGKVPMGWPIGPLLCELSPATLAHFVMTATDNDYFMASLTGLALTSIPDFATAYPQAQEEIVAEYARMTAKYLKRLGWTMVHAWSPPDKIGPFVKSFPGLEGVLEGYGTWPDMTYDKANYLIKGVPVFHSLTTGSPSTRRDRPIADDYKRKARALAREITSVKIDERPAFMHAFTIGWDYGPTILKMVADQLPLDYVIVRPDELAALYKKHKEK
ncbi:MAG: GxGYxYP family putative glycoside hydrolase [Armatimonadota bacterium]|nr:GxGYxYP family putative glycoside hydrolase [Armatimonadota bacterium]